MVEISNTPENSIEITQHQKELLKDLEYLPLSDEEIFDVALVYLDLKRSASVNIFFQEEIEGFPLQEYEEEVDQVRQLLKRMGLSYEQKKAYPDKDDEDLTIWTSFSISKSPQTAAQLQDASRYGDERVGRLLGYPESAVEAFPENSLSPESVVQLIDSNLRPFLYFRPSKEHWKEEIKGLEKKVKLVKQLMPDLYERMIHNHQRNHE